MSSPTLETARPIGDFAELVKGTSPGDPQYATIFVDRLLNLARQAGASDVHLDPTDATLDVRWRLDGVLQPLGHLPKAVGPNVIARLKVLAGLLTYEMALPQEGRICDDALPIEVRVSTFPTLYGERAVIRVLGAGDRQLEALDQLGLPASVLQELKSYLLATSGAILVAGPAGSGKTTTAYACLREIVAQSGGGRSIASLEDPVEIAVEGVSQSQVNEATGFNMATGLRSLLRLDPEVILIGEMRDLATAEIAIQAALTGQLVVTTFHASHCADAVNRLVDMGIPAYAVRNAVRLVVAQRLLRRLCACATPADPRQQSKLLGIALNQCFIPVGCERCRGTGYLGRALVAEYRTIGDWGFERGATAVSAEEALAAATNERPDQGLWTSAAALVEAGTTSSAEVIRVLGLPVR
jgi:type II secretory ATPase GspE/PulE/Tfp pilus assembly ATPase PilB-like protein